MKNLLKIVVATCLMFVLSGCYNQESREIYLNVMNFWIVFLAYFLPLLFASLYQFKVSDSKWYISIAIAILIHAIYIGFTLLISSLTFNDLVHIFYINLVS